MMHLSLQHQKILCTLSLSTIVVLFSSVQLLSCVQIFATPWTTAHQASLSITNSRSLPKLMSIESVMPSSHLILYCPLLLLPSIFPSIRVFSNESALCIRWPKYWSFSFNISPSNEHPGPIPFMMDWLDLFAAPCTEAHQVSSSITHSQSLPKLMSIESVMPSNHLILCRPFLLSPSIFPSIRVFSNESALPYQVAKVLEFQLQHQSFQRTPRTDLL